jgi:hypothetical protein
VKCFAVLVVAALSVCACDSGGSTPDARSGAEPGEPTAKQAVSDPDRDRPEDDHEQASFATPTAKPPPAPEGAIALPDPWLYVQTCSEAHPCPLLKQPAGDAHCRALVLGGHDGWRLPSKAEAVRFGGVEGLEATAGYHWTRTPYEHDLGQVWIVDPADPKSAPATTIPRERKPFRIRCVKEP